jgi:hypothetical protein
MNWTLIILGIVIIILIYILYQYFTSSSKLISTSDLNSSTPAITSIASPSSPSYGYSLWIYVNTWATSTPKTIFARDKNLKLYLDPTSPTLYLDVSMTDRSTKTTVITTNFPIQRWVFLSVSADNQYFDIYMDGKLVVSQRMYNGSSGPAIPGDASVPIYLGNAPAGTGWDATATNFIRSTSSLDPQTVWTTYIAGNGSTSWNPLAGYNVNLNVLQNGVQSSQISVW